jgi:hypothetical protein
MLPMHEPDGLRKLERELRDSAEHARRIREAGSSDATRTEAVRPDAQVLELPIADDVCVVCEIEREPSSA